MLSEQLLSYIKENTKAGYSRAEVEAELRSSGWSDADVSAAFVAIAGGQSPTPTPKEPPISEAQRSTNSEVARIQEELRVTKATTHPPGITAETGIIGFLIRTNMASSRGGAQALLVVSALVAAGAFYLLFLR